MKNKRLLRLFYILCISILAINNPLSASTVDSTMARKAATNFYNWRMGRSVSPDIAQLTYVERIPSQQGAGSLLTAQVNAFYVFDFGGQFVMISADTRVLPILAYSTETGFNGDNMPENLRGFLDQYTQQIAYAIQHLSDAECEENVNAWNQWLSNELPVMATTAAVEPLVHTTWDQPYPYNAQCPADPNGPGGHVYTGCVATAMAQIIRYWQYPTQGIGSHSYTADNAYLGGGYGDYGVQSVDFSAATYDYSLMPLSINSSSPAAQINEVAKLMYHCGVSVDMMYGTGGSGASTYYAGIAFNTYFGYNGVHEIDKEDYAESEWIAILKGELNGMRPILYSGSGTGGHAFVCDGYDNSNDFHFNWGWGGYCDGYFTLSSLTPGGNDFTYGQQAVIGIDASQSMLMAGTSSMSFITEAGTVSASQSSPILTAHLSSGITATATGNFKVSTDNTNFHTSLTMTNTGGTLYVRYEPTATSGTEYGYVALTSGTLKDTIYLTGILYDDTPYCLPPENLSISSEDLHNISLQWDAPQPMSNPINLSWSSGNYYYSSYYTGGDYKIYMMQRFCDTDLVAYHNKSLTAIRFYANPNVTKYKAVVYKGGSYDGNYNPGSLVLMQDINLSTLTTNAWNTVTLNTPVEVDIAQELWFGIYVEAAVSTPAIPISIDNAPTKGSIEGYIYNGSIYWSEYSSGLAYCVIGIVDNIQTVANYTVSRDGTTLGTTANTNYSDYVSSTNTYNYTVTANWDNGCSASVQQSFTNVANITVSPEALDFFANHGLGTLVKTVVVSGSGLTSSITANVTGNFRVSTNGTSFATSATLPSTGGTLFVKYTPASNNSDFETGLVTLTSGSLSATVSLSGQSTDECNPPQDLLISQSGNTIGLNWNTPAAQVVTQQDLTWMDALYASYGMSDNRYYLVQRFVPADLTSYNGKLLTAVSFFPISEATTYRIVVYTGGSTSGTYNFNSGTQVVNQTVNLSSLTSGTWNTITLNNPVSIDASKELWFGIYVEAPSSTYPILVGTPYVSKRGCLFKSSTASNNSWSEFFNNSYCFALKGTIEDVPVTLTHYQIDRNTTTLGTTGNTSYDDNVYYNGTYNYDVWAVWSNGCKAPARGSITLSGLCDPTGQTYTQEACESYTWYGTPYNTSGTYHHAYIDGSGCPVLDTLVLTIHTGTHNVETKSACESYTWHGTTYTSSGIYKYYYDNTYGCASVDTLKLTINHGTHNVETKTACESYTWHGTVYTTSGTHTYPYTNANGCPSVDTLKLTINKPVHDALTVVECESYTWTAGNGQTYWESGNYLHSHSDAHGCTQVDTLHLTINNGYDLTEERDICENELPYTWNGETFYATGSKTKTFTAANSCDSVVTMVLTVNYGTHNIEIETACESFTWYGQTYTTSGTYTHPYTNAHGCASTDTLHLIVNHGTHNVVTETACESFTWHGQTYTTSGTYTHPYTNANGCASVDTLHLIVNHGTHHVETHTACDSYTWHGTTYTTSGTYKYNYTNADGCASTDTLHLTVHYGTHNVETETACESFTWHGTKYTTSGTYTYPYNNSLGCPSTDTLHLTIHYGTHNVETLTVCDSYTWHGQTYTTSGTYTHPYNNADGCASVDTLKLTVNHPAHQSYTVTAYDTYTWTDGNGQTYTQSGAYLNPHPDNHNCTQVDTLHLTVYHSTSSDFSATDCESYTWNGETFTTSGNYTRHFTDIHGADSAVTLHLTIHYGTHNVETKTACESYTWHGQTHSTSGTYTYAYNNTYGCASVDTLKLTIHHGTHNVVTQTACESFTWHGQTYTTSGTYTYAYNNTDGCPSVDTLKLTIHYGTHNVETHTACESYTWHGQTHTTSGTYTHSYNNADGCPSVDTLKLTIHYGTHIVETQTACESYTWHGQTHNTSGTYTYAYENTYGCASVDTLKLTVNHPVHQSYTVTAYDTYTWTGGNGQTYTQSGTYLNSHPDSHNCTQVDTLHLTIYLSSATEFSATDCESYTWNGETFTTSGDYTRHFTDIHGADSAVTLHLTIHHGTHNVVTETACESYTWHGQTHTTSGIYTHAYNNAHGCASVDTLKLTVHYGTHNVETKNS